MVPLRSTVGVLSLDGVEPIDLINVRLQGVQGDFYVLIQLLVTHRRVLLKSGYKILSVRNSPHCQLQSNTCKIITYLET